ncbi:MAG: BamA/TamA family outer membrane protein [candidate division Zixibacteria bacterium]|nr:BamA/TamA family outer membrane protein [candidate division Zixibacteria bacterium]NIR62537.1 BamA/TamA family outer membrane protein [candidate division Zixibacteria bacterium]NIS14780.1 BamA/TamA family outer membrane protein [candidate division Zixibacteria bacterium]NIS46930.1 BamA/TamA family outer membrane protein [candidate division Zixibacteria bacterium]NIT51319.1 BamA/TamA family outer membrane protein [candidate division Zixibacteria bacterium]
MKIYRIVNIILLLSILTAFDLYARNGKEKWLAKKPVIREVVINGNDEISKDDIKEAIATKEQGFFQKLGLKGKNHLKKNSEQLNSAALNYLYRRNGFRDIRFNFEYDVGKDSGVIVIINITEGPQYFIDTATVPDDLEHNVKRVKKIVSELKPGEVLNPYRLNRVVNEIERVFADNGRPYRKVDYNLRPLPSDSTRQIVNFQIDPGPLTVFGNIHIDSLEYSSSRVVRRELLFEKGDTYSREELIDSRQRIYSTGLFTYVDFTTNINGDSINTSPDLTITCSEKRPRFIRVRTGAAQDSTYDLTWDLGLEVGSRNISGMGRHLRFEPTTRFQVVSGWRIIEERFGLYYIEPWPFGIRMPIDLSLEWEPKLRRTEQNIKTETVAFNIGTFKEIGDYIDIRTGFEFESIDIEGISEDSLTQFKRDEEIQASRSLWTVFERDSRLNIFVPRQGAVTRLTYRFYGRFLGGDKNFHKGVAEWSRYLSTSRWAVYAFRIKAGWARSFEPDGYIPSPDLFYIGGANTIRGYKENSIGPTNDDGEPIGGKFYLLMNHEYRRNLVGKFWFSLFLDIGNNWRNDDDFQIKDLLASAGVGLQYISPLGPIRLDYGQRIAWKPVDGGGRFHISILYAF